jgi:dolichol-phosphate mannosyltransferase
MHGEQETRAALPALAIVVPTFNERANVAELVRRLHGLLGELDWEVVFVDDDSPDGTSAILRNLARHDRRVRCVQRLGRRGLSSACIEGVLATSAPLIAIMDADLQHDESLLAPMWSAFADPGLDVVIGSRYAEGGGVGDWATSRRVASRLATRLGHLLVPDRLQDPMSGFFMMRREAFEQSLPRLSAVGFKILLDLFASSRRELRFIELPYTFRPRLAGESKLDEQVAWEYLMLLADKLVGRWIPVRFVAFGLIGLLGVGVHFAALFVAHRLLDWDFVPSQAMATLLAMAGNYTVNNLITYRDRRRRGWAWWSGLLSFGLVCSVGAIANVGVASHLFERDGRWVLAALAGILVGAVWNYAVTAFYTWGSRARPSPASA